MSRNGLASKYDTFIFDWDGTLTKTQMLRKLNERLNPYWNYKKGKGSRSPDRYAVPLPKSLESLKGKVIRRHIRKEMAENRVLTPLADVSICLFKPTLHNGVRKLLGTLDRKGKTLALLSNGASWRTSRELIYLGLEGYFSARASAQDIGALKPSPVCARVLISVLGANPRETIYIGDTTGDIEMAKYAGIASCALSCGFDSRAQLERAKPDYIFDSVEGLLRAL